MDANVRALIDQFGVTNETLRFLEQPKRMFIDGQFIDGNHQMARVEDPSTGGQLAEIPLGTADDVDVAVAAAKHAMKRGEWSEFTPRDREQVLRRIAELIRKNAPDPGRDRKPG